MVAPWVTLMVSPLPVAPAGWGEGGVGNLVKLSTGGGSGGLGKGAGAAGQRQVLAGGHWVRVPLTVVVIPLRPRPILTALANTDTDAGAISVVPVPASIPNATTRRGGTDSGITGQDSVTVAGTTNSGDW